MSEKERASALLEQIPDSMVCYVVGYMQRLLESLEVPNATTNAAMQEVDEMIRTGSGERWTGSTEDFFAMLDAEDEAGEE